MARDATKLNIERKSIVDNSTLKFEWKLNAIDMTYWPRKENTSNLVTILYTEFSNHTKQPVVESNAWCPASQMTNSTASSCARAEVALMLAVMNRSMTLGGRHALMAKEVVGYIENRPVATSLESEFSRRVRQWDDKDLAPHTSPLAEDHLSAIREDIDRTLTAFKAEGVGKLELSWRASKMHRHYNRLELSKR